MKRLLLALVAVLSLAVSPVAVAASYGVGAITRALSRCTGDEFDATCNIILSVIAIVIIVAVGFLIYCFWEMFVKPAHVKFASPRQEFVSPNSDLMAAAAREMPKEFGTLFRGRLNQIRPIKRAKLH